MNAWLNRIASENLVDWDIFRYPCTSVYVAENDKVQMYIPVQQAAVVESLGPRPEITAFNFGVSLKRGMDEIARRAKAGGLREVYFMSRDEQVNKVAEWYGFQALSHKVYRLKLENKA